MDKGDGMSMFTRRSVPLANALKWAAGDDVNYIQNAKAHE